MKKQSLILASAIAATLTSGMAVADVTGNAAATTNYLWRGVTQTADAAAVQGGVDWSHDSGAYAGIWASGIAGGQEVDYYGGFATDMFDVGVISYQYPVGASASFTEAYVTGSYQNLSAGAYYTVDAASGNAGGAFDTGDIYVTGSFDYDMFSVFAGSYFFDNDSSTQELNYIHYGVSVAKDDFTFSLEKNDINESNAGVAIGNGNTNSYRAVISWSKEWDL